MAYGVITPIDDNIVIEKTRNLEIVQSGVVNRFQTSDPKITQIWSDDINTNNYDRVSFSRDFAKPVLLGTNAQGVRPVTPEKLQFTGNAQLIGTTHNVYISTFDIETLYADAWSNTLEIYVKYNDQEIILSSVVVSQLQFKLAKFDLEYGNRFYSNYCAIQCLDLKAMALSGNNGHLDMVAKILGIPTLLVDDTRFSTIQYRFGYIPQDSIVTPPVSDFLMFDITAILSKPENPASWSLQGDLDVHINVVGNTVVIGMDQSNPDLMNILKQIGGSTEFLQIQYTVTFTGYRSTVDPNDFEYNGVHYKQLSRYSITCSNTYEPQEAITLIPAIAQESDMMTVDVFLQITSSNNTISLSRNVSKVIIGTELAQLKQIVYNIQTEEIKINNVIETTQNVIQFQNTKVGTQINSKNQLQFATLTAININGIDGTDVTDDSTITMIALRTTPMVYAIKLVTVEDIDLRKYESLTVRYAGKKNKPVKVEKDTIYVQLSWQDFDEIGIEINDVIATVIGARRA